MASPQRVNLAEKLSLFDEHWRPKVVGELNGQHVKLVKLRASSCGTITTRRDGSGWTPRIGPSESRRVRLIVEPRGVEHRPVAEEETSVLLFESEPTLNTGNVRGEMTTAELDRI